MKSSEKTNELNWAVIPGEKYPMEYHQYLMAQDIQKSIFLNSIKNFKYDESEFYSALDVREKLDMTLFEGLSICDKVVSEVGCGIFATVQALFDKPTRRNVEEVVEIIDRNNYYVPGKGLRWSWFDNFCRRPYH